MGTPATAEDDPTRRRERLSRAREVRLRISVLASRVVVGMARHLPELRLLGSIADPQRRRTVSPRV